MRKLTAIYGISKDPKEGTTCFGPTFVGQQMKTIFHLQPVLWPFGMVTLVQTWTTDN